MASESKRGCGYRKVGSMYLVGGFISTPCDRLPYRLECCPTCGAGIHFTRAMTEINPLKLFGTHDETVPVFQDNPGVVGNITKVNCYDKIRPCWICDPTEEPAYIMFVGEKHYPTPADFIMESEKAGISKRIPFIPKNMVLGKTIVYLAHNKACIVREPIIVQQAMGILYDEQPRLLDAEKQEKALGLFCAFVPKCIEKIYWQSEIDAMAEKDKESLTKRGITAIGIPDGDKDHI